MKIKNISIIILFILSIGCIIGGVTYKIHMESSEQQKVEIQHIKENTHKVQQTKVQQVDKEKNESNNSDNISRKIESTDKNKSNQLKREKVSHSDFESKVSYYLTEFKKSKDDIATLNYNFDSINTNNLNETEKLQLTNLKLAAKDWSILTGHYDYVRQAGKVDSNRDKTLKYAKEALEKINTKNLITTGIMSKESVDNKVSFLKRYIDNVKMNKEKEIVQTKNIKKKTTQERAKYYYKKIKDAKKKQTEYINSFNNPEEKQSLQTSQSAAIGEATLLEIKYPEDTNIIEASLKKVLDGE